MELTAQDIITEDLLHCEFAARKGSDAYRHAKDRKVFIIDFKRDIEDGKEKIIVSICFDKPNQSSSLAWFNASDLIFIKKFSC